MDAEFKMSPITPDSHNIFSAICFPAARQSPLLCCTTMKDDGDGQRIRRMALSRRAAVLAAIAFLVAQHVRSFAGLSQFFSASLMYPSDSTTLHPNSVLNSSFSDLPDLPNVSHAMVHAANESGSLASGLLSAVARNESGDDGHKPPQNEVPDIRNIVFDSNSSSLPDQPNVSHAREHLANDGDSIASGPPTVPARNESGDQGSIPPGENEVPDVPDHPHQGARDADGRLGYITDATKVRRRMIARYNNETGEQGFPPTSWFPRDTLETFKVCDELPYSSEATSAMAGHWDADAPNPDPWPLDVLNTSAFTPEYTRRTEEYERYNKTGGISSSKILCAVYTHAAKHEHIQVLIETWGWRCDGFFAASTATVEDPNTPGYGAINLTHKGEESYKNMWQVSSRVPPSYSSKIGP